MVGIPTFLYILQISEKLRAKSVERETETKNLFRAIIPLFQVLDDNYDPQRLFDFIPKMEMYKDDVSALEAPLQKTEPTIANNLAELISFIDKKTHGRWTIEHIGMWEDVNTTRTRELVSAIRKDIDKWLAKRA